MAEATGDNQFQDGQTPSSEVDFVALRPGQTIGRYEITAVLGQGGFGITYRARDAQLHREVAIKEYLPTALAVRQGGTTVLPRSTKVTEDFSWGRQRFVEEGRTLASLEHAPAIVQVFDFLEENGTAYIVMKLVPGETLENRLRKGTLSSAEIDRILWPLLDGLERVHNTGFLHRDIKPANILLDGEGNPTLIDFGASRAAVAGRSSAMTAIFTPGYAAAEQMTSAKQGPWTDIYGVAATVYHAITGTPPPSAFDRMLEDGYVSIAKVAPPGFSPGMLIGIDAGLAVRATDRPQTISGWRQILGQASAPDARATVALARAADSNTTQVLRRPSVTAASIPPAMPRSPSTTRGLGLWIGLAVVIPALAGGGYWYFTDKAARDELAREAAAQVEQEKRVAAESKKAEEDQRKALAAAEAAEAALNLSVVDRRHVQVALKALGFDPEASDGVFAQRTRDALTDWQNSRSYPPTGFLSGPQNQTLLRDAGPAVTKFDDEEKKKTDEEKASLAAMASPPAVNPQVQSPLPNPPAAPPPPALTPPPGVASIAADGMWQGTYECQAGPGPSAGPPFTFQFRAVVSNGYGIWVPPVARGTLSIAVQIKGEVVTFTRTILNPADQTKVDTHLAGKLSGGNIMATGLEKPVGRACTVLLARMNAPAAAPPSGANRRPNPN